MRGSVAFGYEDDQSPLTEAAGAWHNEKAMPAAIDRITVEPGKRGGKPCIRGLRITVWDVLGWLGAGMISVRSGSRPPSEDRLSLLLDENLSPRLVARLSSLFPIFSM